MAWNSSSNKSLNNDKVKSVGPGAPIASNPTFVGKAYKDGWDIERAYREGMQKVTWVSRCIDAIAGNQARLIQHFKCALGFIPRTAVRR